MQIILQFDKTFYVTISEDALLSELQDVVYKLVNVRPDNQMFYFKCISKRSLSSDDKMKKLSECEIRNGNQVHLAKRTLV